VFVVLPKKHKIISIVGSHSCGSTLLSRLLGESDGILNVGEILNLLAYMDSHDPNKEVLCSCKGNTDSCSLLGEVYRRDNLSRAANKLHHFRNIAKLLFLRATRNKQYHHFLRELDGFLQELCDSNNSEVIIEASKALPAVIILSHLPNFEISFVHIVRDPISMIGSWKEKKVKTYLSSGIFNWNVFNFAGGFLKFAGKPYLLVRYEDFVESPREILENITSHNLKEKRNFNFVQDTTANLTKPHHHLLGNSRKSQYGLIHIKTGEYHLGWFDKMIVRICSLYLMIRYRY
jgi:hypothetical protein